MANPTDDDVWHVQLGSGEVCMMTLDLLDDAFQDGLIHEGTLLWQEGSPGWMTLAQVAGLDVDDAPFSANSVPAASASFGPTSQSYSTGPLSTAPVAADIGEMDFDLEAVNFRPRKRSSLRWMAAAAMVGVAVFGFTRRSAIVNSLHVPAAETRAFSPVWDTQGSSPAAGALIAAPPTATAAPTVGVSGSLLQAATSTPTPESRLSDETKRALEEADKKLASKQQARQQQLQSRPADRPRAKVKSENPFHKGGNKFDPLNSSL